MSTADDRFLHDVMCCFCVNQRPPLREHSFRVGLKLEILHPTIPCAICPGTVFRIINKYYFIATVSLTCHLLRHRPLFVLARTLPLAEIFSIALTTSQIDKGFVHLRGALFSTKPKEISRFGDATNLEGDCQRLCISLLTQPEID